MTLSRSVSTPPDNELPTNHTILSNPNLNHRACSGYTVAIRSGDAYEYVGQYPTVHVAVRVIRTRLRLLGKAFGQCRLEHTDTGIRATYANNASIEIDIQPSECDGHVTTHRKLTLPHCGTDSLSELEVKLDAVDSHAPDGTAEETTWHVWLDSALQDGIRPRDIPRLIDALRVIHDVWLECSN